MTKFSFGLAALAFALAAPLAAQAATHHSKVVPRSSTFTGCKTDSDFTYCGNNLVGVPETSNSLYDGGGGNLIGGSGAPIVKILEPNPHPYSGGNG